jgi:hypothetical protein
MTERSDGTWYGQAITRKISLTITFSKIYCCARIVILLILLLCRAVSIFNLFCLHHPGIQILVILHTILFTIQWWLNELPLDLIHSKSKLFLFVTVDVILCSTEFKSATTIISFR